MFKIGDKVKYLGAGGWRNANVTGESNGYIRVLTTHYNAYDIVEHSVFKGWFEKEVENEL